ncbi:histone deacetylase [Apiospora arundinis]
MAQFHTNEYIGFLQRVSPESMDNFQLEHTNKRTPWLSTTTTSSSKRTKTLAADATVFVLESRTFRPGSLLPDDHDPWHNEFVCTGPVRKDG